MQIPTYKINNVQYAKEFVSFTSKNISHEEEFKILIDWIKYMDSFNQFFQNKSPKIYHWSNAEPNFYKSAVVRNKKVLAIEGKGGTQQMLNKCKTKKFKGTGVLVKLPKKKQDLRIDLPTVGLKTLKQCKSVGLKGIILKNKQNVFLEKKKMYYFRK